MTSSNAKVSLRETVPVEIQTEIERHTCVMAEVAAGPTLVALRT